MASVTIQNGKVEVTLQAQYKNTLDNGQVTSVNIGGKVYAKTLDNGVESEQANRAWSEADIAISGGGTVDIDLYDFAARDIGAGNGRDGLGLDVSLEEIVAILIEHTSGAGSLEIMPANPANYCTWLPSLTVANGGALKSGGAILMSQVDTDAFDIEDGVSHMARFGANGGAVTMRIHILGRHDDNLSSSSSSSQSSSSSLSSLSSSSSTVNLSTSSTSESSSSSTVAQSTSSTT